MDMANRAKTIFLDTNVFLHYKSFDQIDWLKQLGASNATIVLPPITLRELNKQKERHPHKHIRERAGKTLKRLKDIVGADDSGVVRQSVVAFIEDREPLIDFAEQGLQKEVQDDNLIASILFFQGVNPGSDIVLVTADGGLLLVAKARRFHISTLTLPEDHKLPEESDPDRARVKKLEEEILRLNSSKPVLALTFEDGKEFASFPIASPIEKPSEYFTNQVDELIQKYPKMGKPTIGAGKESLFEQMALSAILQSGLYTIPDEDMAAYNAELDQFVDCYKRFLEEEIIYDNMRRRTIELKFVLSNNGTSPGENIDICLHFNDGCAAYKVKDFPPRPAVPTPPEKPKPAFLKALDTTMHVPDLGFMGKQYFPTAISQPPRNVSPIRIEKSNSFNIRCSVAHLKHTTNESIDPFYVVFDSYDAARSFNIEYKLLADNIPEPTVKSLNVIIMK